MFGYYNIMWLSFLYKCNECRAGKGVDTWVIFTSLPQNCFTSTEFFEDRKDSDAIVLWGEWSEWSEQSEQNCNLNKLFGYY